MMSLQYINISTIQHLNNYHQVISAQDGQEINNQIQCIWFNTVVISTCRPELQHISERNFTQIKHTVVPIIMKSYPATP